MSSAGMQATDIEESLKLSLVDFFRRKPNIERVLPIINRTSNISLRILEYFAVNYSRLCPVSCVVNGQTVDVYESYRKQLKTVSKSVFDPFRRGEKFQMCFDNAEVITTTWGQLCFFRWLLQYGILDYIEANLAEIQAAMKQFLAKEPDPQRSAAYPNKRSKRRDVQYTAMRTDSATDGQVRYTVTFD
ncbi:hypothetical protein GGF32_003816 [Allomyces javanicus]|nr:hypothetical protein GGF32_003816 [Allomyces javanicus]